MEPKKFKIVLVGDGATGKTTFVKRHKTGEFDRVYNATVGATVHNLKFYTTRGAILFEIWDTAGQEKLGGLRDGYYVGAHGAILFFDVTSLTTYRSVNKWFSDLTRVMSSNTPIVLVGNKIDVKDRKVKAKQITFHRKKNMPFYEMSAKSNYNLEKPILFLLRNFFQDNNLQFIEEPAYEIPELSIDPEIIRKYNEEVNKIAQIPLEVDSEDENL